MSKFSWSMVAVALIFQSGGQSQAQDKIVGATEFLVACSSCHGVDGRSGGPVAAYLTVKPPDLTRLSERNGGQFPFLRIFMTIDGRAQLRTHVPDAMPIFGELARQKVDPKNANAPGTELIIRGRMLELVNYLEAIQVGAGKDRLLQ